ncbi:MAG: excinuclease ABC subunit UvrA [Endomicrobia bacterium]|nr:excinuclease ABC subunit UvrA [Endomicrobiia bacterium]
MDKIIIIGAKEHNLKNINLELPKNKLIVITGLSGSGKSSLAFDTIYAEGQRRYVESLSAYAKQFLPLMDKPDVEKIEGLSPAIAIDQRPPSHNPRSTVGTTTEIYDYLRLLYARIGKVFCPHCDDHPQIRSTSSQQIVEEIIKNYESEKITIYSPIVRGRIGTYQELLSKILKEGFVRVRIDNKIYDLDEMPPQKIKLDRYKKHTIEILVDQVMVSPQNKTRIADSIEIALRKSQGLVNIALESKKSKDEIKEKIYSEHFSCIKCGYSLANLEPRMFSFNSPYGACPSCDGLGYKFEIDPDLVVPDKTLSINEGAIKPFADPITTRTHRWKSSWRSYYEEILQEVAKRHNIDLNKPFNKLPKEQQKLILYGDGIFEGVINNLQRRYQETESDYVKEEIYNKYISRIKCPLCNGARLKKESLFVKINTSEGYLNISEICSYQVKELKDIINSLILTDQEREIAKPILKEINHRIDFLISVGLDYITLDRETSTLAGGEAQRIHLATQIGSGLTGVLYVLDEPTVGLHPRDTQRLVNAMISLRDIGNTLIVVEHDENVIKQSDWLVDLGPKAGVHGGEVMVSAAVSDILNGKIDNKNSLTLKYLHKELKIEVNQQKRKPQNKSIKIIGAQQFNLKNIDVEFPLGVFICVTGVSGSGKSTLVNEILYKAIAKKLYGSKEEPGKYKEIIGVENIDKIIIVDQSPIGRTPRSNPATYTGVFTYIRELFAQTPEARRRGYDPGRFSFNVKGGRCENCQGDGVLKIEMQFLPDVYVKCDVCQGKRFNEETLQVKYKDKNIYEVLEMTVEEALEFFGNINKIRNILSVINDVGLGYIKLGQPATTLSGGEAQRIKLAAELCKKSTGKTLYILDEPTTGLHYADVEKLLKVLHKLVDLGNTVIVIEHNLEVIKTADWIVDLGPEGGQEGGYLVYCGDYNGFLKIDNSYTAKYLKSYLESK